MSSPASPLFGSWTPPGTVPGSATPAPPNIGVAGSTGTQNPYGQGSRGSGNLGYNLAETNLQTGLAKNALIPWFTQMMSGGAGPAMDFFKQLMNAGSPFYQRKQQQTFEQGSKAAQDAAGQARQAVTASGAGYGPSGVGAAMMGGMGQAEAGNQEEAFLNNLFQNEQLMTMGGQELAQLASLFNPAQLTGQQISPQIQQPTGGFADSFSKIMGSIFPKGVPTGG